MGGPGYSVEEVKLEKAVVWYLINNCGDGIYSSIWYLTSTDAERAGSEVGNPSLGRVETYVGSNIYKLAVENSNTLNKGE